MNYQKIEQFVDELLRENGVHPVQKIQTEYGVVSAENYLRDKIVMVLGEVMKKSKES